MSVAKHVERNCRFDLGALARLSHQPNLLRGAPITRVVDLHVVWKVAIPFQAVAVAFQGALKSSFVAEDQIIAKLSGVLAR